jgi:hypothetical protein
MPSLSQFWLSVFQRNKQKVSVEYNKSLFPENSGILKINEKIASSIYF